jgi:hypothetical protein
LKVGVKNLLFGKFKTKVLSGDKVREKIATRPTAPTMKRGKHGKV